MATFEFHVKQIPVASSPGQHTWEAIDNGNGYAIPLPSGGTGMYLGSFPEIADYLRQQHGIDADLDYVNPPDALVIDRAKNTVIWTFLRAGHTVIVKDMPRLVWRMFVGEP